jgi:hypothetical protein
MSMLLPREIIELTDEYNELYAEIFDIRTKASSQAHLDAHPLYHSLINRANAIALKLQIHPRQSSK